MSLLRGVQQRLASTLAAVGTSSASDAAATLAHDAAAVEPASATDPAGDDDASLDLNTRFERQTAKLHRYERKFNDLVASYKNIVKERKNFQKIVQATSSFADLSDPEGLHAFYLSLTKSQEVAKQEITRLTQANADATTEIANLKSRLDDRETQLQKMKQDFVLMGQQLAAKRGDSTASQPLSVDMAEQDHLRSKVKRLEEDNTALEAKVKQMTIVLQKYTANRSMLKERMAILTAQNQTLQRQVGAASGEMPGTETQGTHETDDLDSLNTASMAVPGDGESDALQQLRAEHTHQLQQLNSINAALQADMVSSRQAAETLVTAAEHKLHDALQEQYRLATSLSLAEERLQTEQAQYLNLESQLRAELEQAKSVGETSRHDAQKLGTALALVEEQLQQQKTSTFEMESSLRRELESQGEYLHTSTSKLEAAEKQLEAMEIKVREANSRAETVAENHKLRMAELEASALEKSRALEELQGKCATQQSELQDLTRRFEEDRAVLESRLKESQMSDSEVVTSLTAERANLLAEMQKTRTELTETIHNLQLQLEQVTAARNDVENALTKQQEEFQQAAKGHQEQSETIKQNFQMELRQLQQEHVHAREALSNAQTQEKEKMSAIQADHLAKVTSLQAQLEDALKACALTRTECEELIAERDLVKIQLASLTTHKYPEQMALLQAELEAASVARSQLEIEHNQLAAKLTASNTLLDDTKTQAESLEAQLSSMRAALSAVESDRDAIKAECDSIRSTAHTERDRLTAEIHTMKSQLEDSVATLKAELDAAHEDKNRQSGLAQASEQQIQADLASAESRCEALQSELSVKQHELDEYSQFCRHLEKANQALLQENETNDQELATIKTTLQQAQDNVSYQRQENERKSLILEENTRMLATIEAALDEWKGKHDLQASQLTDSLAQLERQQRHYEELEIQLGQREDEVQRLRTDLQRVEQSLKEKSLLATSLQQETDTLRQSTRTLEEDKQALVALNERLSERVHQLEQTCGEQEILLGTLQQKAAILESVQAKCERLEKEIQVCRETLVQTDAQLRNTEDNLSMSQASGRDLTTALENLKHQLTRYEQVEEMLHKATSEVEALQQGLAAKEEDWRVKESQLKALNKTLKEEVRKLGRPRNEMSTNNGAGAGGLVLSGPAGETVNLEYLKHCVLKYMEFDDQRSVPLIKVIGLILKFTPEELNRIQAKAQARLNPLSSLIPV